MEARIYRSEGEYGFTVENKSGHHLQKATLSSSKETIRLSRPPAGVGYEFDIEPATTVSFTPHITADTFADLQRAATLHWWQDGEQKSMTVTVVDEDLDEELARRLYTRARAERITWQAGVPPDVIARRMIGPEGVRGLTHVWQLAGALEVLRQKVLLTVPSGRPIAALFNQNQDEVEFVWVSQWESLFGE